jgi:hypothetical protein
MYPLKNSYPGFKNFHLITSVILIIPIALVYGLYPGSILPKLFDLKIEGSDLTNIFRAIMGLYLGMATIWIIGIFKPKFWTTATITNIVFMGGLAFGRLLSLILDGLPSVYLSTGFILELVFAFWGLRNLKKYGY